MAFRVADAKRAVDLDRKAAMLGRKLVKGLEMDDEEDDYYDVSDMEFSGIVFSSVKRYFPTQVILKFLLRRKQTST